MVSDPIGGAELTIVDAGALEVAAAYPRVAEERRMGVLRGPCYLALRRLLAADHGLDGIILVAEPGRALNERDVADVTGLDVVATVPITPGIVRTIDAGLSVTRHQNQREFRHLRRWLTAQLDRSRTFNLIGDPLHHPTAEWLAQTCQVRFAHLAVSPATSAGTLT